MTNLVHHIMTKLDLNLGGGLFLLFLKANEQHSYGIKIIIFVIIFQPLLGMTIEVNGDNSGWPLSVLDNIKNGMGLIKDGG